MTRLSLFASLMMALVLAGCTFQPDGDVITEIEVAEPNPTIIDFFEQTDTVLVRGPASFPVSISSYDPVKSYTILIDGTQVGGGGEKPWSVSFNSTGVPDGVHKLSLVLTKQRIGKSMAAQMGLETYEQTLTRTIETFNKPIVAPPVTASIQDGTLTLQWQPYTDHRFERYDIYASGAHTGAWIVQDAKQSSLRIEDFIGGKTEFSLVLRAFNTESKSSVVYDPALAASIDKTTAGVRYQWQANPFKSCTGFQLVLNAAGTRRELTFPNSTDVHELTCSYLFPHDASAEIFTLGPDGRKVSLASFASSSVQKLGGTNPKYHPFHKFVVPASNKSVLLIYYLEASAETYDSRARVAIYNRITGEELAMKTNFLPITPDGKGVFHIDFNTIDKLDPATLNVIESVSIAEVTGGATNSIWQVHASNDNKVLLYSTATNDRRYFVYDWQSRSRVFNEAATFGRSVHRSGLLGNGGRRFYNLSISEVLRLDVQPVEYFTLQSTAREIALPNTNTSVDASSPAGTLTLKSAIDQSVIRQVSYPYLPLYLFANYENELGIVYSDGGKIKIDLLDQHTLSVLTTLETQMTSIQNYKFRLSGNELFVHTSLYGANGPLHSTTIDFKR